MNITEDPMYFIEFMDEINENIRKKKPFWLKNENWVEYE